MKLLSFSTLLYSAAVLTASPAISTDKKALIYGSDDPITLVSDGVTPAISILDFGQNFEGHPVFEVVALSGDTSRFEVTFAESAASLSQYESDGPLPLAAAMETHRVKGFNITKTSLHEDRLIQGAFRYQKLNLSTAGELVLQNIGVRQTVHTTPLTELPGSFQCSDDDLTRIWHTGARTAQLTEIPKNSIPDFWIVSNDGAFVESLASQPLAGAAATGLLEYQVSFEAKPTTGALMVSVLMDTLSNGIDVVCDFTKGSVYALFERSVIASANLTLSPDLNSWVAIATTIKTTEIQVAINNSTILSFSQDKRFFGAFGLGAPLGHSVYYRDLVANDLTGDVIYSSALTDRSFLDDFLMGSNPADTIVDGSRRDRIAYNGDLDIALAASFASTYGSSFVQGSLVLMGSFQLTPGFFVPTAKIQQGPSLDLIPANITGLIGYSFNLVTAFAQNYMITGDVAFARQWAPAVTRMLDWADSRVVNGLFTLADPSFTGDWNYYDPPQTGASSKFNAVYAYALQQSLRFLKDSGIDTSIYEARLASLRQAMHKQLFDTSLGMYVLTSEVRTGFSQDAQAIAILAGVPQANNASITALLSTMERELLLPAGPLAFSNSTVSAGFAQKISPYASSYHLRAAFESGDGAGALGLLKRLWAPMANPQNANYTNCFWETLNPDGTPGLGLVTSLCHGWAAGPTAELIKFVLGIQPVSPGFKDWVVKPMTLGLSFANGRQHTEKGDISVHWHFDSSGFVQMNVTGPKGGLVHLPTPLINSLDASVIKVNGEIVPGTDFPVAATGETIIVQERERSGC